MKWAMDKLDIVGLNNMFRNPPCSGQRKVIMTLRQSVPTSGAATQGALPERRHISTLSLLLQDLHEIEKIDECTAHMHSIFETRGIQTECLDSVVQQTLLMLDFTDGSGARDAANRYFQL